MDQVGYRANLIELETQARALLAQQGAEVAKAWLRQMTPWNNDEAGLYVASLGQQAEIATLAKTSARVAAELEKQRGKGVLTAEEIIAALQYGLFLERSRLLLPWHAPLVYLARVGRPAVVVGSILEWPDELIFNGLSVSVSTGTLLTTRGLYHINCKPANYAVWGDPWIGVESELAHLSSALGMTAERWIWGGYQWRLGHASVALKFYDCNEFHYSEDFHKYVEVATDFDLVGG